MLRTLLLSICICLLLCHLASGQDRAPVPVAAATVTQESFSQSRPFLGVVVPLRTTTVGTAVDGRVGEMLAREGDRVEAGEPIMRLLSVPVEIQLAAARAELEARRAAWQELQNGSRPEEIEQAEARYLSQQAAWEFAQARHERMIRVREQNAATQEELQLAKSAADQAYQGYVEAKAAWQLATLGPREEQILHAKALHAVQEQQVRALEDQLAKHTLHAPYSGYIIARMAEVGQWLTQADPVVTIVELDEIEIQAPVDEAYLAFLTLGTSVEVTLPAIAGRAFSGQVSAIIRQGDVLAHTFPVKVRLSNEKVGDGVLLNPGMQANIRLPIEESSDSLLVPKDALVLGGKQPVVFVVTAGAAGEGDTSLGVVRRVSVTVGRSHGSLVSVAGELKRGDMVVTRGNERLVDGQQVRVTDVLAADSNASAQARENPAATASPLSSR